MITRYLLIVLTLGMGLYRVTQGAWLPSAGLFAMGGGLIILKLAEKKPALKPFAYACFLGTAVVMAIMLAKGLR